MAVRRPHKREERDGLGTLCQKAWEEPPHFKYQGNEQLRFGPMGQPAKILPSYREFELSNTLLVSCAKRMYMNLNRRHIGKKRNKSSQLERQEL